MSQHNDNSFKEAYKDVMGEVPTHTTMDKLTSFLYVLMRDDVPPGVVTRAVIDANIGEGPFILSNGPLAQFAEHLSHKLRGTEDRLEELESNGVLVPSAFRKRLQKKGEEVDVKVSTHDGTTGKMEEGRAGVDVREEVTER